MATTASALRALERLRDSYDAHSAGKKLALLRVLAHARFRSATSVLRWHEALCFLRAYPDSPRVLASVERALAAFGERADLRRHAAELPNSGVAGTEIWYPFFWPMAAWLAERFPAQLKLDRDDAEASERIARVLPLLVSDAEAAWLRAAQPDGFAALERIRPRQTTDATFFVKRIGRLPGDTYTREAFHDSVEPSYILAPSPRTPARTHAKRAVGPIVFQRRPLGRTRPDLRRELARAPERVQTVSASDGRAFVELARSAMVTRERDLDAFTYGDARDVRIVHDGGGLAFMLNGVLPERRALLPAIFGALTLRNGVPIGYIQLDVIGALAELSFNTFETFRGGEAAYTFARMLALARHVCGASSFSIEPYQLGKNNKEGIASGAWWFYYKLGFAPRAAAGRKLARRELEEMIANPAHRSSEATLHQLAEHHLFFDLDPSRPVDAPPLARIGESVARALALRGKGDRALALEEAHATAMHALGLKSLAGFNAEERRAWSRWAPLVLTLPGVRRWRRAEKRALVDIIRAKGARSELVFLQRFARHARLARALLGQ